ncbi:MAG TPA: hypothetical protein VF756_25640 [Thermoanaerobaculia bacterium]
MGQHPDPQLLERFMRAELKSAERKAIVRHLLTGCPRCVEVTRRLWALGDFSPDSPLELEEPELLSLPLPQGRLRA